MQVETSCVVVDDVPSLFTRRGEMRFASNGPPPAGAEVKGDGDPRPKIAAPINVEMISMKTVEGCMSERLTCDCAVFFLAYPVY
jgi:hypothetical protein